jgi:hypothetical protein
MYATELALNPRRNVSFPDGTDPSRADLLGSARPV